MEDMHIEITRTPTRDQLEAVRRLWNKEFPKVIAHADMASLEAYLGRLGDIRHIFITDEQGRIAGWYMDFLRDGERWFVMIIAAEEQGKGYGRKLLNMGLEEQAELNGWVVSSSIYEKADGTIYMSPLPFYIKQGVRVFPDITFETQDIKSIKIKLSR